MNIRSTHSSNLLGQAQHCKIAFLLIAGLIITASAQAQQTVDSMQNHSPDKPVEVLVLGTFHFTGAPDFNAIDAPEQQREVRELVDRLAEFNPTKIALEFERNDSIKVDSLYRAYRSGDHKLTVNERQQIGFRMAGQLDHEKVYAIDYKKPWGMRPVFKWAKENEPWFVEYFHQWKKENANMDSLLHRNKTLIEILSYYSKDEFLDKIQEFRMRSLEVGANKNYLGINPVASVYERNMRIFANLTAIAEPGDRILIVYGAGHSYFFNSFIEQHPQMNLVDANKYLKAEQSDT